VATESACLEDSTATDFTRNIAGSWGEIWGKLGMSFALTSPVSLISDDLLGEIAAWRICKGSILETLVVFSRFFDHGLGRKLAGVVVKDSGAQRAET
jgi:hypothetical protein